MGVCTRCAMDSDGEAVVCVHRDPKVIRVTEADTPDCWVWDILVEWRGGDRWSVTRGSSIVLSADGEWGQECARFIEDDAEREAWLAAHRFDLPTALAMAEAELPRMRINGRTALDILARRIDPRGTR